MARADTRFSGLETKKSTAATHPFARLKVKVKREIVALGAPQADPARAVGVYVRPEDWNNLIQGPGVLTVDVRNAYEVKIGSFRKAINPETRSFREFPRFVREKLDPGKHKKIAMFCTGGIRCEKASSYLLAEGFQEVYHLEGGILKYLKSVPNDESLWEGECFVFDERVALAHGMAPGSHRLCRLCGAPAVTNKIRERDGTARLCDECASTAIPPGAKQYERE